MNYTEKRTLSVDDLRNLCIEEEWYTNGTNREYKKLFTKCNKKNLTTNDIVQITNDIYFHTYWEDRREREQDLLNFIRTKIISKCKTIIQDSEIDNYIL